MKEIAVIGAGLSALTLAQQLKDVANITIFEKSRGVGGRMSTRYADPYKFDHGAQFFTVRSIEFKDFLSGAKDDSIVQEWTPKICHVDKVGALSKTSWDEAHYVACPNMNSLCKYLAEDMNVQVNTCIDEIRAAEGGKWQLRDDQQQDRGTYDFVISTAPAEQSLELLASHSQSFEALFQIEMQPCFSVMLGFEQSLQDNFDVALFEGHDVSWIACNNSKPGRTDDEAYVIHSSAEFAQAHHNHDKQKILEHLIKSASDALDLDFSTASLKQIHFWKYARPAKDMTGKPYILDADKKLAVCGDGFVSGRVESAFISALELSKALKASL